MGAVVAVFSRGASLPSFAIRTVTGAARWSHCGVVDIERGLVIEALAFKGVVDTPLAEWCAKRPSHETVHISCPDPHRAVQYARQQIGKPYDYLAAAGVPWRTPWDDPRRWYCSELLEAALAAGGRHRWRLDKRGVSPMESWMVL